MSLFSVELVADIDQVIRKITDELVKQLLGHVALRPAEAVRRFVVEIAELDQGGVPLSEPSTSWS